MGSGGGELTDIKCNCPIHHFHIGQLGNNAPCRLAPPPPKKEFCLTIVFDFSWHDCNTQERLETMVVYHLPQIPGNSGWDVNSKVFFGSSHRKIPGTNGKTEKVVPFSRLGRSEWKFVHHLQVS